MKKKGITLAAGIVTIGCLFGVYFLLRMYNEEAEGSQTDLETVKILDINTDNIKGLAFWTGETQVSFQCEDDAWSMEGDQTFPVNENALITLLSTLSELDAVRTLENVQDSSEYGMDDPQNEIRLEDTDGKETVITIGSTNNSTGDDYVMVNEDSAVIYTVDSSLRTSISDDLYDYAVSETLPQILAADICGVSVERIENGYQIYRADDTWCAEDPDGEVIHADKAAVNSAFSKLASAIEYTGFVEHNCMDGSAYGLDEDSAVFTVLYEEEGETESEESTEAAIDTESGSTVETETKTETETETGSDIASETVSEAGTGKETGTEAEAETETETAAEVQVELRIRIGSKDANGDYYVQWEGSKEVHTMAASVLDPFLNVAAADWAETADETEMDSE